MSVLRKITYKKIAITMLVLFLISLLPILYCSFFDYATGDDLFVGAATHRVLMSNGSIKDFFTAVCKWVKMDYFGWEGTWSSSVLWSLEPSIWGEKVYCVTPWIALFSLCGSTVYFLSHFLKKYLDGNYVLITIVSVIICFFSLQYMPYHRSGIFWYTGMVHYVVPFSLCLVAFVWADRFIEVGKKRYCISVSLICTYLGGAGYPLVVLAFEIMILIILMCMMLKIERTRRVRSLWLTVPLLLLIGGFVISAIAPGNAVRGGDGYYFGVMKVIMTVVESIKQGFKGGISWFVRVRPLFLTIPILFIVTWEQVDITKIRLKMKYPILGIILLFLISCSIYAPGIYSQAEVSGGVPNSIYLVFLMTYILGTIYMTCYLKKVSYEKQWGLAKGNWAEKFRIVIIIGEILFCILFGRHLIGNMTGYVCMDFIRSGQLEDFEYQMQERLAVLHDPGIMNVVLPEMNDEQGPFMHMALLSDPGAYTNRVTAQFYGKESVIAIPRTEYYKLYGYPEDKLD